MSSAGAWTGSRAIVLNLGCSGRVFFISPAKMNGSKSNLVGRNYVRKGTEHTGKFGRRSRAVRGAPTRLKARSDRARRRGLLASNVCINTLSATSMGLTPTVSLLCHAGPWAHTRFPVILKTYYY